ncbi:chaperone protein dnaJ 11, chloroplastic-like [Dorcoceras hygrometricum]|uniref:Chaperone protein dnaJ 11, chloroplastic-like n=1 Tax=Dorcoceras hygrometricum TaxID=472368 RepID=A0A2Z7BFW0_9LAMI|nr:chaperone protein dnaJ 11, chloroplastic-like [Dorcoceras hygrometricum]
MACTSPSLSSQIIGRRFSAAPAPSSPAQIGFRRPIQICSRYATAERTWAPTEVALQPASFYDILGIQDCASGQEIKSAYRKLARVLHPDVASGGGEDAKSASHEFMRVHAAYATLSDPEKRELYDITLSRRRRREAQLAAGAPPGIGRRRRNWETDQCW